METWWERRRGGLPWEMLRLWWIGAIHASATCRVNEEWRPSSSLDGGEGEGEQVGMDDGGGKASWHGLQVSPLWLVQSSEHWSWMLGWDKLQSSREGSTLKRKDCSQLLQDRSTSRTYCALFHVMFICLCVIKPLCQEWAQGMFLQSLSGCQEQVLGPPEEP